MGFVSMPFAGIREGPHPCLSASPAEAESEPRSLEPLLGVATWEAGPEAVELLDHLRLSVLTWDEGVLETLSPELSMGTGSGGGEAGGAEEAVVSAPFRGGRAASP